MKLYITAAGVYAGTQVEAKADGKGWQLEEVPTDKYGLIDYLNKLVHKGSGLPPFAPEPVAPPTPEERKFLTDGPRPVSYTDQSVAIDEVWDKLPLARKLHFAALAMEDARAQL